MMQLRKDGQLFDTLEALSMYHRFPTSSGGTLTGFYVVHECDRLSTEFAKNASQIIREIRPLQEITVEELS